MLNNSHKQFEKRFLRNAFLFLYRSSRNLQLVALVFFAANNLHAQTPVPGEEPPIAIEKPREIIRWLIVEKSIGVVPQIDFVNGTMGLGICRGKFIRGTQRSIAGTGYFVGLAYDTEHRITYADFGAWAGLFKKKIGGQVGIRGLYYLNEAVQSFAIRPELGIGFVKMQLSYGYNIFLEKADYSLATHTVTLSAYFAIHSEKVRMY